MTFKRVALIALAVVGFLAIAGGVARCLKTENTERDAVYALLRDQARGDAAAMLRRLDGCARDAGCRALAARDARTLRRPGTVKILAYDSGTSYALGAATGPT